MREPAATVREPALTSPLMMPPSRNSTRLAFSMFPMGSPADDHDGGLHQALQMRAGVERHVAVDLHITLEPARDAHVAGADDLALDGQVRGDDGFFHVEALLLRRRTARNFWGDRGDIALLGRRGRRRWRAAKARRGSCGRGCGPGIRVFPKRHEMAPDQNG